MRRFGECRESEWGSAFFPLSGAAAEATFRWEELSKGDRSGSGGLRAEVRP
jgi:hypothetical protein